MSQAREVLGLDKDMIWERNIFGQMICARSLHKISLRTLSEWPSSIRWNKRSIIGSYFILHLFILKYIHSNFVIRNLHSTWSTCVRTQHSNIGILRHFILAQIFFIKQSGRTLRDTPVSDTSFWVRVTHPSINWSQNLDCRY